MMGCLDVVCGCSILAWVGAWLHVGTDRHTQETRGYGQNRNRHKGDDVLSKSGRSSLIVGTSWYSGRNLRAPLKCRRLLRMATWGLPCMNQWLVCFFSGEDSMFVKSPYPKFDVLVLRYVGVLSLVENYVKKNHNRCFFHCASFDHLICGC